MFVQASMYGYYGIDDLYIRCTLQQYPPCVTIRWLVHHMHFNNIYYVWLWQIWNLEHKEM